VGRGVSFVGNKAWGMSRKSHMSPVVGGGCTAEGRGFLCFGYKDWGVLPKG